MKDPVIITAPHSYGDIPKEFKDRLNLSDFEIWQMHDPFTDETAVYPEAFAIHQAQNHRILGDINRDRNSKNIFKEKDFYHRKIWKEKEELTKEEKEVLLKKYWDPFREAIKKSFEEMTNKGVKKILFIDHHNTATDHSANHGEYLPPINLGNYGDYKGNLDETPISASFEIINAFQASLKDEFPELSIEMNKVYKGSSLVRFIQKEIQPAHPDCEIHSIHLEYNLNLIFNPLSKEIDKVAKEKLHQGINKSITTLIKNYF